MMNGSEVFTPLAEDYARYRPGYPEELYRELVNRCGLTPDWVIADIGSGTGNASRLFLDAGHTVMAVEPNREMRKAAERLLAAYPAFHSLDGTAEHIPLADNSADLVVVGQALHWFDVDAAKREFWRILRNDGWVAVTWNDGQPDGAAFMQEYIALTRTCAEVVPQPCTVPLSTGLDRLFGDVTPHHAGFPHAKRFDLPGLLGRARSSCYLPQPGAPYHDELTAKMTDLFNRHQQNGLVTFNYLAQLYVGRLIE